MTTHPLQFGQHAPHPGHGRGSSASTMARGYFMPKKSATQTSADEKHAALVQNTQKWVAQTFYGEMLKQMRNSPFRSKMFDGGDAGKTYNQMFDSELANHLSAGAGKRLVDNIVSRIEHPKGMNRQAFDAYRAQKRSDNLRRLHRSQPTHSFSITAGVKS